MKQNPNVPAFLTKLWTLVENSDTNELICWSQEGNSFLVLDEQRFAKEILPKFFKHNNMASFVRQLNMYGFRKVMHVDTGVVKQERDGPVEFQHPYFKQGKDDLLEHIKRKVSSARPEDSKIRHEDLSKILSSMQNVHDKQESIDSRLAALKRENEALWTEMSDLRQKHAQQQHVIKELVQFILSLLNMKRKRPLLLNSNSKKAKFIHQLYEEPADHSKAAGLSGVKNSVDVSEDVIICDVTDQGAEITVDNSRVLDQGDVEILEVDLTDGQSEDVREDVGGLLDISGEQEEAPCIPIAPPTSSALQLNKGFGQEDPVTMMDSILNESGTISQNINLLGKVELMDYLDSIDCSLEDFQALLYGKQFSMSLSPAQQQTENTDLVNRTDRLDSDSADKQLIQYTSCPLLAYLDGCTPLPPGPEEPSAAALADSVLGQVGAEPGAEPGDLLEPDPERPPRSSLIRLEPLTEAEASETTLFYLCELNPELPCADTPPLDL